MGKKVHDSVLDGALNIIDNATRMVACSAEPTDFADIANVDLADVTLAGGDFTDSDGDTSGRKVRIAAKAGVTIDTSGTANHVSLDDGSTLLYVTTCTAQALTAAGTVDFPAWDIEIADPT